MACVESLLDSTLSGLRILVCDNGSVDETSAAVRAAFPQVSVVELGHNRGFAACVNTGLRLALDAGAEHVLVINNDTVVDPPMVERLLAETAPDVGAVGPLIYYADQPQVIWSAGSRRSKWTLELTQSKRGQQDLGKWARTVECDFLPACALLLSRAALELVGLFDENFFMYYEDSDLCLRLRRLGFRLLLVPGARMWHKVSASSGGADSPAERYAMARSSVTFFRKYVRGWHWGIVGPYRLASAAKTTIRLLTRKQPTAARAYWRGLADGFIRG